MCGAFNVVQHYGKRIKILHGCPFEGWPNRIIPPFLTDVLGWPCPVRSALKRTPTQDFNSFSIMFCYIIKGQIKPKADWRTIDSPKKRTNEFGFFAMTVRKYLKLEVSISSFKYFRTVKQKTTNWFVRFLGESMAR